MVAANSSCSVTCSLPKGAFTLVSLHVIVSGRLWRAPAGALSRSPRASFSSSDTLPPPHTHNYLGKDVHRLAHQDKVFSAQACRVQQGKTDCTPPRTSPPSVPCQGHSQGTARILVPYEDDTVCTVCVAVLSAQPSSWCFRLLLQTSALVAGKLE